jgi:hypothetical protein
MSVQPFLVVVQFGETEGFDHAARVAEFERTFGSCSEDHGLPECFSGTSSGAGTAEFFVATFDPVVTVDRMRPQIGSDDWRSLRIIAWQSVEDDDFAVIWPDGHPGRWAPPDEGEDAEDTFEDHEELRDDEEP